MLFRRYSFSIKYDTFETRLGTDSEQDRIEWVNLLRNLITKLKLHKQNSSDKNDPKSTTEIVSRNDKEEDRNTSLILKSEYSNNVSDILNTFNSKEDAFSTSANVNERNI
jgi:hypothetical protein